MNEQKNIYDETEEDPSFDVDRDCGICMHPKSDPVTTTCGHAFCWECINDHVLSIPSDSMLWCPMCFEDIEA
ncbi:E3 ubiquitin-protein ligase RMA2-like [Drosophila obscura]|uniref:E3 ubiquitin-protein ligase RMA2-like n=1 Tax=Drosophila obscura TaxID=7282 RepID=UPI000B9FA080|nr:E3 ubiquitin-protein ligase RMA2-like [Drosophila obscura]